MMIDSDLYPDFIRWVIDLWSCETRFISHTIHSLINHFIIILLHHKLNLSFIFSKDRIIKSS